MRRLLIALPLIVLGAPALAQPSDIPPDVDKLLVCSTVFSLKADDDQAVGDEGGHLEWSMRADELSSRAGLKLADTGLSAEEVENVNMNYALTVGFEVGMGGGSYSLEDCQVFVE